MEWIIRHHTAILLWITAVAAWACSTTCYDIPLAGIALKAVAIVFIIGGLVEASRKEV